MKDLIKKASPNLALVFFVSTVCLFAMTHTDKALADATLKQDAQMLHAMLQAAGDAGHTCATLIDLKQPASQHCDKFRELTHRINSLGSVYQDREAKHKLMRALEQEVDHTFKDTIRKINRATDRLGWKYEH